MKLRLSGSSSWHVADVVYIFKHVLDLAVLRIRAAHSGLHLQPAVLQPHAVKTGQPIAVVGLFSPSQSMLPTITTGNVSKVGRLCPQAPSAMLWLHVECCCCIARPCETSMLLQLCGSIECCLALLFRLCSLVKAACRLCGNAISKDGLKGGKSAALQLTTATVHAGASGAAIPAMLHQAPQYPTSILQWQWMLCGTLQNSHKA